MTTDSKPLLEAIHHLKRIIGGRETLPILSTVKLHTERNRMHISATNLDEWAREEIEASGTLEPVCVSARFLELSIFDGEVKITATKGALEIESGGNTTKLSTFAGGDFPAQSKLKDAKKFGVSATTISEAMKAVDWAASTDESRYILNSVLIQSSTSEIKTVSTNGRELAMTASKAIGVDFEALIPSTFAENVEHFLSRDGAVISMSDNHLLVEHSEGSYCCKLVDGKFPNYKQVIPANMKPLGTIKVDEMKSACQSIVPFLNKCEVRGVFTFSNTGLRIDFQDPDRATLTRYVSGKFKDFKVALNLAALLTIFSKLPTDEAKLEFVNELSPLNIQSGDLTVLTMPMRPT